MTTWDIHLAEAQHVVRNASASAEDYVSDQARVEQSLGDLAMALPRSPHVAMRLGQFADEVIYPLLQAIFDDTAAALAGTTDALSAYHEGDLEMASRAQSAAARVVRPDVPGAPGMVAWVR